MARCGFAVQLKWLFHLPPSRRKMLRFFLIAAMLFAHAVAASDNLRPDSRSTSQMTISLAILPALTIETVSDVHFNIERRDVDASYDEYFCVRGTRSARYSITAYGSNTEDSLFALTNSEGSQLLYTVGYRDKRSASGFDELSPGLPSRIYEALDGNDPCDGDTNFNIRFRAEDLEKAQSGLYSGSLTLVVAPV